MSRCCGHGQRALAWPQHAWGADFALAPPGRAAGLFNGSGAVSMGILIAHEDGPRAWFDLGYSWAASPLCGPWCCPSSPSRHSSFGPEPGTRGGTPVIRRQSWPGLEGSAPGWTPPRNTPPGPCRTRHVGWPDNRVPRPLWPVTEPRTIGPSAGLDRVPGRVHLWEHPAAVVMMEVA